MLPIVLAMYYVTGIVRMLLAILRWYQYGKDITIDITSNTRKLLAI